MHFDFQSPQIFKLNVMNIYLQLANSFFFYSNANIFKAFGVIVHENHQNNGKQLKCYLCFITTCS